MKVQMRTLLVVSLFVLVGCSSVPPQLTPTAAHTPTPKPPKIVENSGQVCFYTYRGDSGTLEGKFYPRGCYSSSCTRVLEQNATATADERAHTIHLKSRFVLLDTTVYFPEPRSCSADCNGGGEVSLVLQQLTGERYEVFLGAETLGILNPSEVNTQHKCLGPRY